MAVAFRPGATLVRGDLDIFLTNAEGNAADAYEISYAIFWIAPGDMEVLIGSPNRVPISPTVGEYYASLQVPPTATPGTYHIRWTFKQFAGSPPQQVLQEWAVVTETTLVTPGYTPAQLALINSLRVLLRDQNPDKFYHFKPPEAEGNIGAYNAVFGQIWEDAELLEYLIRGLDWFNMFPPATYGLDTLDKLVQERPAWRTAVLWEAITHACFALATMWSSEEFDYSIGGISLSIERSSKYESLKQNAEGQFDKAVEAKKETVKFMRGLSQPKYGVGVRSAFGPAVGRGILSPRNFL